MNNLQGVFVEIIFSLSTVYTKFLFLVKYVFVYYFLKPESLLEGSP